MIKSTQKVIRIGSSGGVTIPAKALKENNIEFGDKVKVTIEPTRTTDPQTELVTEYKKFKETYGETLKNLANR